MTPFLSLEEAAAGEEIVKVLMPQLQKLNPKACIAALGMILAIAAHATEVPLESIFQMMRNLQKSVKEAEKNAPQIVTPDEPKIIVP